MLSLIPRASVTHVLRVWAQENHASLGMAHAQTYNWISQAHIIVVTDCCVKPTSCTNESR